MLGLHQLLLHAITRAEFLCCAGASKADARKAYRELAKKWHPDKHPNNVEEAKLKFQAIQKAYDSLMTTDEDAKIEALGQ